MENFDLNKSEQQNSLNYCGFSCNGQEIYSDDMIEEIKRKEYFAKRKFNRIPLILSLMGLLFSFMFGLGIALAIPSLIISIRRHKKAPSKPLRWAIVISVITIFLSVIFIACTGYAVAVGFLELINGGVA